MAPIAKHAKVAAIWNHEANNNEHLQEEKRNNE